MFWQFFARAQMNARRAAGRSLERKLSSGAKRPGSQFSNTIYRLFMGSNVVYGTTLLGVAIVGGYAYDGFWDAIWKAKNRGKLFDDVIPQRFPNPPEGTEPDEEDDEDDDDDDDDDDE